jgi:LmbE family N-acetylglucosaminyl deacetylase
MMRADEALMQMRRLPLQAFGSVFGRDPILILAPHPDDESLGCGGLIAEACRQGTPPIVAILTDGSKSHPDSRTHPAEIFRKLREDEAVEAVEKLGLPPSRVMFLRYPDTGAPSEGEAFEAAVTRVGELIDRNRCRTVAVSWQHDPHCDHAAAAAIARAACQRTGAKLLAYPVWGWTLPPDMIIDSTPITGFRLDVANHLPAKRAAIEAHRSQYAGIITDDPEGFQMKPEFMELFRRPLDTFIDVDVPQ